MKTINGHQISGKWILHLPILFITFIFYFLFSPARAQIGTWRNYLAYSDIQEIRAAGNDNLFVLASNGLYQYNKTDQSIYTYDKINGLSDTYITHINWCPQAKHLIAVYQNSNIDLIDLKGNITNISDFYNKLMTGDKTVSSIRIDGIYAYLVCGFGIVKVNMQRAEIADSYTPNHPEYPTSLPAEDNSDYDKYIDIVKTLKPGGPKTNLNRFLRFKNNTLFTCTGIASGDFLAIIPATISTWNGNDWTFYQDCLDSITGHTYMDIANIDVNPNNPSQAFAGGRVGLYEFNDGKFVKEYNYDNSDLKCTAVLDHQSKNYTMVQSLVYDNNGHLWLFNSGSTTTSLWEINKDGQWINHHKKEFISSENRVYDNIVNAMFDSRGILWACNDRFIKPALICYNPNTDEAKAFTEIINQDGTKINIQDGVRCVAEDLEHNIWIGSSGGPFLLESSEIENNSNTFTQVKVPRNDGTNYADYLLAGIDVSSIAIDGGNRKWIGTLNNGVYLISADNMTQIQHFTTDNSPLLSNMVTSVAINHTTGEVFFATDNGLCSYISDATETNTEMTTDNVWAYPNPVEPGYTGNITITGLSLNANIKILTANGAIVNEGHSNGGTYVWDGRDQKGRKVASGIYMVTTATSTGEKGTVCKIAIVN